MSTMLLYPAIGMLASLFYFFLPKPLKIFSLDFASFSYVSPMSVHVPSPRLTRRKSSLSRRRHCQISDNLTNAMEPSSGLSGQSGHQIPLPPQLKTLSRKISEIECICPVSETSQFLIDNSDNCQNATAWMNGFRLMTGFSLVEHMQQSLSSLQSGRES